MANNVPNNPDLNTTGGIIYANNATFRNNKIDVAFLPYQNFVPSTNPLVLVKDQSNFVNCTFVSDLELPYNQITAAHVSLEGVDGVTFQGADFDNQLLQLNQQDRGSAIYAYNSSFTLKPYGANESDIEGFYTAIYSYTTNPTYTPTISNSNFMNNVRGIELIGNNYASITECSFEIIDASSSLNPVGLYLNTCTGYEIEENIFTYSGVGIASNAVGLLVYNSLNNEDEVYKNEFNKLQVGTLVHGDNKRPDNKGLVIKCNEYTDDGYHVALNTIVSPFFGTVHPEIALNQGGNLTDSDPAGNTFGPICTNSTEQDYFISSGGSAINYYHHIDAITTPNCRTVSKVTNIGTVFNFQESSACASNISTGGGGPWGEELVRQETRIREQIGSTKSGHKNDSSVAQVLLNDYVRTQLILDTIGLDSIVSVLGQFGNQSDQIRMLAAMARRGDSIPEKSQFKNLSPLAKKYLDFNKELSMGSGKTIDQVAVDPASPYHIWALASIKKRNGKEIPNPVNLPKRRNSSIDDINREKLFNLYPNPVSNKLNVRVAEEGELQLFIYDGKGSLIKSLTLNQTNRMASITTSDLINGLYILKLNLNGKFIGSEAFAVQH